MHDVSEDPEFATRHFLTRMLFSFLSFILSLIISIVQLSLTKYTAVSLLQGKMAPRDYVSPIKGESVHAIMLLRVMIPSDALLKLGKLLTIIPTNARTNKDNLTSLKSYLEEVKRTAEEYINRKGKKKSSVADEGRIVDWLDSEGQLPTSL